MGFMLTKIEKEIKLKTMGFMPTREERKKGYGLWS